MTDILKGKTNQVLIGMSLPIGLGMLSTFLFQIVDTYFVSKLGSSALAALSFSSTIYLILISLYIGLSIGVSIIIGQSVGRSDMDKVHKTTWVALTLSSLISILISAVSIFFIDKIFTGLGAQADILPLIRTYTIPVLIGMPLLTFGIIAGGILRASGNIKKPEIVMVIAGVLNLIFDYALIFGIWGLPEMGIQGAAYATVISWIFAFIGMTFLLMKDKLLEFSKKAEDSILAIVHEIFKLGLPTILTQIIGPATITFLTYLLAKQSSMAVAAFGVISRIEMLLLIGILALSTAITPFVAQNSGAKAYKRIGEAITFGRKAACCLGLFIFTILFLFVDSIATIFSIDSEVISHTSNYFYIISISYIPYSIYLITTAIFNGMRKTLISLKITIVKSVVFAIPLTLIGSFWNVNGIFIGLALANILAGIYATIPMRKEIRKHHPALQKASVIKDYQNDIKWLLSKKKSN